MPYVGFYKMLKPAILLRDADLIRDILTKDFHSFRKNETIPLSEKQDKLTLTHPFFVIDEAWKETRKSITPVLSTNKVTFQFSFISKKIAYEIVFQFRSKPYFP